MIGIQLNCCLRFDLNEVQAVEQVKLDVIGHAGTAQLSYGLMQVDMNTTTAGIRIVFPDEKLIIGWQADARIIKTVGYRLCGAIKEFSTFTVCHFNGLRIAPNAVTGVHI